MLRHASYGHGLLNWLAGALATAYFDGQWHGAWL